MLPLSAVNPSFAGVGVQIRVTTQHLLLSSYKIISITALLVCLTSCAATDADLTNAHDPYERYNRAVFGFNMKFDNYVFRPVAKTYKTLIPWPARTGVTNFFSNMAEVPTILNDVLQANVHQTLSDSWRLLVNTTFGVAGLVDFATPLGLEKHYNDFGITLAKWGYKKSAFVMMPFFGPSTIRDSFALLINYQFMTLWPYIEPQSLRYSLFALDAINLRSSMLGTEKVVMDALDPYVFVRDAYLQRRAGLVTDKEITDDPYGLINHDEIAPPSNKTDTADKKDNDDWAFNTDENE